MAKLKQAERLAEPAKVEEPPTVESSDEFAPEKKPVFRPEQGPPLAFHEKVGVNPETGCDIIEPKAVVVCANIKSYMIEEYANLCERNGYELHRTDVTDTGRYTLWFRRCRQ